MRKILFRGKRTDNGEWIFGYYEYVPVMDLHRIIYNYREIGDTTIESDWASVIPSTVGQYTGLTDKNGKKIFEGDIIDTPDRLVKVVWFAGNAQFDLHFIRYTNEVIITNFKGIHMRDLKEYEVIGNIHDNPELLDD